MIYDQVFITFDQLVPSHDQSIISYDEFVTPYDQLVLNYDHFVSSYDQLVTVYDQFRPVYDFGQSTTSTSPNDLLVYSPFASRYLVELQVR